MAKAKKKAKNKVPEKQKNSKERETKRSEEKVEKTKEKKQDNVKPSERPVNQILPYVWFVISLFLLVCFISRDAGLSGDKNILGPIGEGIHLFFYGIFGLTAYLIPVSFILLGIFWRKIIDRYVVVSKIILVTAIIILTSAVFQVFVMSDNAFPEKLWENGNKLYGGGVIGGTIGWLLYLGLSKVGSLIVIFAALFLLAMFVFDMTPHNLAVMIRAKHKLRAERRAVAEAERLARIEEEKEETEAVVIDEVPTQPERKPVPEPQKPAEDEFFDDGFFDDIKTEKAEEDAVTVEPTLPDPEPVQPEPKTQPVDAVENVIDSKFRADDAEDEEDDAGELVFSDDTAEAEEVDDAPVWNPPPVDLLIEDTSSKADFSESIAATKRKLRETLESFDIGVKEIGCSIGPTITRYEVVPETGIRVKQIANLVDDITMSLASEGVRIEAPIPGKAAVGIEVPNEVRANVRLRTLIDTDAFRKSSNLTVCLGQDVAGKNVFFDIKKMPHMLIAGTTGSGKSVAINCIVCSLLYKNSPDMVKLIMIDPKKVEFTPYKDIPHLYCPIISDPRKAAGALSMAVKEMEDRYTMIEEVGVRDVDSYNELTISDPSRKFLPKLIIVIDELADLMMTAKADVEQFITRIAQKARAVGIHLVIGTQRPSVDVVTGLIKANVPSRIACAVKSQVDSRTMLDIAGAEKLIGRGDMLFSPIGLNKPMRVQGAFLDDAEISRVVDYIKSNNEKVVYNSDFMNGMEIAAANVGDKKGGGEGADVGPIDGEDVKFREALEIAIKEGKIATSLLQRRLGIGYGRAAKLIDRMCELGYISEPDGNKPRQALITLSEFYEKVANDEVTSTNRIDEDE
ncbi:MAG: DNA translocase FtsK [Clostridia bacterium]|nr:DNA translocase FtsK [Clostridia bacterium]